MLHTATVVKTVETYLPERLYAARQIAVDLLLSL